MDRRKFLGTTGCAALGYTTLFSSLLNLKAFEASAASAMPGSTGYKAMVCVLLSGGNDSYNMLMPRNGTSHQSYLTARSGLAIPQSQMLPINPTGMTPGSFGVHPSMPEVKQLFDTDRLSFIANVGTLAEPTNKTQYESGSHPLPLGLFSHSDQVQHWQTGRPLERGSHGWGGRIAELVNDMNSNQQVSMNISISGSNLFQKGPNITEYTIDQDGGTGLNRYGNAGILNQTRSAAIDNMLDRAYADVFERTYMSTVKDSHESSQEFMAAMEQIAPFQYQVANSDFSRELEMIGKTIAAKDALGFSRQIFFVSLNGWDHHDELIENHALLSSVLSEGLGDFYNILNEIGMTDDVTTFTISDFGRTLTSNGNGTDHGWGGNAMVMGGGVNGGRIFGEYPNMDLGSELDIADGVFIPTTSADEYMAELAIWFGVNPSDLNDILPQLPNFYDTSSGSMPIGFMNT